MRSLALLAMTIVATAHAADDWSQADRIVSEIQAPVIPARELSIATLGATVGSDVRPAILAAIEQLAKQGGGRVVVPAGTWLCNGPIHLRSNIELHLADGALVRFSPKASDYLPVVRTRWEGTELMGHSPLIYARDVHDVAITGKGILDGGEASEFHEWRKTQEADQLRLRKQGNDGTPVERRVFGAGTFLRPSMIQFFHAERVLLQDYTLTHSPFWVNHLVYTKHAVVRNVTIDSHHANNDGVDIDSSSYVLVERNTFRTGDDAVVVKSGRDHDGREVGRPSEYVVVRNNDLGGEDGIALGSEMSGSIRHVFILDNTLRAGTVAAIRFKANLDRGGTVEHIRVRNLHVESCERLFWFQLDYPGLLAGGHPSTYRDVVFENIDAGEAKRVFEATAPKEAPLRDVTLRHVHVGKADKTVVVKNVTGLTFEDVTVAGSALRAP